MATITPPTPTPSSFLPLRRQFVSGVAARLAAAPNKGHFTRIGNGKLGEVLPPLSVSLATPPATHATWAPSPIRRLFARRHLEDSYKYSMRRASEERPLYFPASRPVAASVNIYLCGWRVCRHIRIFQMKQDGRADGPLGDVTPLPTYAMPCLCLFVRHLDLHA